MKMNKNAELKEEHKAMCERVNAATRAYYEGKPIMSDAQFDRLYKELERFEAVFPMMRAMHFSPIDKIYHVREIAEVRGLKSLKSTDNLEEISDWLKSMRARFGEDTKFTLQPKFDGFNIAVYFEDDKKYAAFSRSGFSIDPNMVEATFTFNEKPSNIDKIQKYRVIGECFVTKSDLDQVNKIKENDPFTDSPHAAFSIIMAADFSLKKYLSFNYWSLETDDGETYDGESQTFKTEIDLGRYATKFEKHWSEIGIPTDGFVIKIKDHAHRAELGSTAKSPNWAIAYKWATEEKNTTVIDSREVKNGYVVSFEPVEIKRKKLCKAFSSKKYWEGDTIKVTLKSNCVPQIVND